jgi:transcription elongation factor GreB
MGRWRPPRTPGSRYITPEGHRRLKAELDELWRRVRPEVTAALAAAAAEGDRSENAEYIYRKKQLREIDARIRHLGKRLEDMRVVDTIPDDRERVFFGAWVTLEDDQGATVRQRIVGPDEFDHAPGYMSMDAPLARALMGKRVGDEVRVRVPAGERAYEVLEVDYAGARP